MTPAIPEDPAATGSLRPAGAGGPQRKPRARYRNALRHRDLRLLITAFMVNQVGSWSYLVVISVYVFDRTHSTQWLAALAVCRWAPGLLLASYGGVLADRYQRVTVMMVSALASATVMTAMAVVVATGAPIGFVLVLAAVSAVPLAPYQPAAGALTPEVVGEKDLAAANSIFSVLQNLVVVLGPGIGGLLLLTGRPVIGVAINAASFAAAAALVSRLRVRSRGGGEAEDGTWQQLTAGLKALGARPVAVAVILFCALDSAVYGASTVLYVPLSVRLGTGTDGYGYLLAGSALGGLLGASLANRLSSASRLAPVIMGSICVQALPYLATVPVRAPALAAALQVISGVGMAIVDVLALTSLQRDLPGEVLGRVLGVFDTVVLAGILLASAAAGVLLAHAGVAVALVAVGAGIPVIALAGLPALLRADRTSAMAAEQLRPLAGLLSGLDLLAGSDYGTLERLAAAASEVTVPAGQVIIREGDPADALWVLVRGALSVRVRDGQPGARDLPPVTAPGYVGELGLLHGIPRTATVRASQDSELLRIGGQDFMAAQQSGGTSRSMVSVAGTRMARTPWVWPSAPPHRAGGISEGGAS